MRSVGLLAGVLIAATLSTGVMAGAETLRKRGEATFATPGGIVCQVRIGARDNLTCARRSDGFAVNCYEQTQCSRQPSSKYWGKMEQVDFFKEDARYPVNRLKSGDVFDNGSSICSILATGLRCSEMDGSTFTLTSKSSLLTKATHPPRLRWS